MGTYEDRITYLEMVLDAQVKLNFILMPLILSHEDRFKAEAADVLRQALVSPAVNLSPLLAQQIRSLRDVLVLPIPEEIVEAVRQPSIRPVE